MAIAFLDNHENKACIDHIDGYKLNKNLENLRFCSHSENARNTKLSKGVVKVNNKYKPYIYYNYKNFYLGVYDKLENAVKKRVEFSKVLYGKFKNVCENIIIE